VRNFILTYKAPFKMRLLLLKRIRQDRCFHDVFCFVFINPKIGKCLLLTIHVILVISVLIIAKVLKDQSIHCVLKEFISPLSSVSFSFIKTY